MIDALSDKSELDDMFIHKDKPDSTDYLLSLLGGAKIGKSLTFGDFSLVLKAVISVRTPVPSSKPLCCAAP